MALSSDEEFWIALEASPALKPTNNFKITDFFTVVHQSSISIQSVKYEKVFSNMRLAKEVELNTQKILVRKQTIKEVENNIEEIKNKYEQEVNLIVQQNQQLKSECVSLRKRLKRSVEANKIQEFLLTCCRIEDKPVKNCEQVGSSDTDEVKALKTQVKLLRNVCRLYMDDIDSYKNKIAGLEKNIQDQNQAHCLEIKKLEEKSENTEKDLKKETEEIKKKFEAFKEEVKGEMELNNVINKKLVNTSCRLKEELKNAQIILNTPRLRQKTMERFKSVGVEKMGTDRSSNVGSLVFLPSISTEKEVFSTHYETPRGSNRVIEFPGSKKRLN